MPTDEVSSVGSASRDYSTPDAFMVATASRNCVSEDIRLIGRCYSDPHPVTSFPGGYWVGATVDSTRYRMIDVEPGHEWNELEGSGVYFGVDWMSTYMFSPVENYKRFIGPMKLAPGPNSSIAPKAVRGGGAGSIIDSIFGIVVQLTFQVE